MSNKLTIEGSGSVKVTPDMMRFTYELVQDGPSYASSFDALKVQYENIVKAFKKVEFNISLIKTSGIEVSILHPTEQQPKRFRCVQRIVFEDRINLHKMSALLDCLRTSDDFNFSLSYFLKDTTKADDDALILAINQATDKAKIIAEASGIRLGHICNMDYVNNMSARPMYRIASADMMGTTMTADDVIVSQSIVISWDIK
ncbi:SIMPL domain-containing protein [Erysipelothrix tonsillarum]|uniref:SIMPL domain-containing protein n=1 Tax=Erysipelothrix tonsillarum TaxID=38402 RepID=UPI00036041E6|nr:SIMPL domain-containing protein [Erysipelothrix tonsillarum]